MSKVTSNSDFQQSAHIDMSMMFNRMENSENCNENDFVLQWYWNDAKYVILVFYCTWSHLSAIESTIDGPWTANRTISILLQFTRLPSLISLQLPLNCEFRIWITSMSGYRQSDEDGMKGWSEDIEDFFMLLRLDFKCTLGHQLQK